MSLCFQRVGRARSRHIPKCLERPMSIRFQVDQWAPASLMHVGDLLDGFIAEETIHHVVKRMCTLKRMASWHTRALYPRGKEVAPLSIHAQASAWWIH